MSRTPSRAVLATVFFVVGVVLMLPVVLHHGHAEHPPAPNATSDMPPMGWTEVCHYAALGDVCQTYPPGDPRSEPTPPPAPFRVWASLNTQADN